MEWIEVVINFVRTYYQFIALAFSLLIFILNILILGLKNRQPLMTITASLREWLPVLICRGENTGLKGVNKLKWVTDQAIDLIQKYYPRVDASKYSSVIHILIEELLTTPQKKGV